MAFELPPLPYQHNALAARGMCQQTLELHHDKHHQAYVTALNGFVEKNPDLQGKSLDEIVSHSHGKPDMAPVFNNAGQHWNHILFWQDAVAQRRHHAREPRDQDQGGLRQRRGVQGAVQDRGDHGQFGSGWAWLVLASDGKLKVTKTPNGSNPLADRHRHGAARARRVGALVLPGLPATSRPDYVTNFLDKLANYEFADAQLKAA